MPAVRDGFVRILSNSWGQEAGAFVVRGSATTSARAARSGVDRRRSRFAWGLGRRVRTRLPASSLVVAGWDDLSANSWASGGRTSRLIRLGRGRVGERPSWPLVAGQWLPGPCSLQDRAFLLKGAATSSIAVAPPKFFERRIGLGRLGALPFACRCRVCPSSGIAAGLVRSRLPGGGSLL